jgi:endonuclease-3 related protein
VTKPSQDFDPIRARPQLRDWYRRLLGRFGPRGWWPAQTTTEIVVGAILTQNTAWANVERALANLAAAQCLDWPSLNALHVDQLAELIKPSGIYRIKAARLKAFVDELYASHDGSLVAMLAGRLNDVRAGLLAIHGIGPETADAILLYAGGHASFVVDAYTMRVLRRHFLIGARATYDDVQELFHQSLGAEPKVFNEYHALLVQLGKEYCLSRAKCEGCPLADSPHDAGL